MHGPGRPGTNDQMVACANIRQKTANCFRDTFRKQDLTRREAGTSGQRHSSGGNDVFLYFLKPSASLTMAMSFFVRCRTQCNQPRLCPTINMPSNSIQISAVGPEMSVQNASWVGTRTPGSPVSSHASNETASRPVHPMMRRARSTMRGRARRATRDAALQPTRQTPRRLPRRETAPV